MRGIEKCVGDVEGAGMVLGGKVEGLSSEGREAVEVLNR